MCMLIKIKKYFVLGIDVDVEKYADENNGNENIPQKPTTDQIN